MTFLRASLRVVLFGAATLPASLSLLACETEEPTKAVVENAYSAPPDGGDASAPAPANVITRAWWVANLFDEPLVPGAASSVQRSVPESDFAYALLAPGWDPESGRAPSRLVALRSKAKLAVARGDTLHIVVSDATFSGSCDANQPLSQEDADFVTQRIFPGAFAGMTYDAKTCAVTAVAPDASARGEDAAADEGGDATTRGDGSELDGGFD